MSGAAKFVKHFSRIRYFFLSQQLLVILDTVPLKCLESRNGLKFVPGPAKQPVHNWSGSKGLRRKDLVSWLLESTATSYATFLSLSSNVSKPELELQCKHILADDPIARRQNLVGCFSFFVGKWLQHGSYFGELSLSCGCLVLHVGMVLKHDGILTKHFSLHDLLEWNWISIQAPFCLRPFATCCGQTSGHPELWWCQHWWHLSLQVTSKNIFFKTTWSLRTLGVGPLGRSCVCAFMATLDQLGQVCNGLEPGWTNVTISILIHNSPSSPFSPSLPFPLPVDLLPRLHLPSSYLSYYSSSSCPSASSASCLCPYPYAQKTCFGGPNFLTPQCLTHLLTLLLTQNLVNPKSWRCQRWNSLPRRLAHPLWGPGIAQDLARETGIFDIVDFRIAWKFWMVTNFISQLSGVLFPLNHSISNLFCPKQSD